MRFDLHSHSTCSDGLLAPAALVERAVQRGVDVLALTDHDEVKGLPAAREAAAQWGLRLIDGVEISVLWETVTLHIVGLAIDTAHAPLVEGLAGIRTGRELRAVRMAHSLDAAGIAGSLEGARRYAKNPELVSRSHFARYLVETGHARDTNAVFRNYLTPGKPGYVPHQWAALADALGWINGSGGIAVLAHPGRYDLGTVQCERLLGEFVDLGGAAVEVVTGSHAPSEFVTWARHARQYGLLASAGSDFHGPGEGYRDIGNVPALPSGCEPVWARF
jgi:predicted metal-dependent phosphoesterase TrpH